MLNRSVIWPTCLRWFLGGTIIGFVVILKISIDICSTNYLLEGHSLPEDPIKEEMFITYYGHKLWSEIVYKDGRVLTVYDIYHPFGNIHPAVFGAILIVMTGVVFALSRWCYVQIRRRLVQPTN